MTWETRVAAHGRMAEARGGASPYCFRAKKNVRKMTRKGGKGA